MNPLLVVLNPRAIPECVDSLAALPTDRLWVSRMTEHQIMGRWPEIIQGAKVRGYTHLSVISDDTIVPLEAWQAILQNLPVGCCITGWCNLQEHADSRVNLSDEPLTSHKPEVASYTFPTAWDVLTGPHLRPSFFTGMCLTTMSLTDWETFPFMVYGQHPGFSSDYHLSFRLQAAKVPIRCVRRAFVKHVKGTFNAPDNTPGRGLLIGVEPEELIWDAR